MPCRLPCCAPHHQLPLHNQYTSRNLPFLPLTHMSHTCTQVLSEGPEGAAARSMAEAALRRRAKVSKKGAETRRPHPCMLKMGCIMQHRQVAGYAW
jgi:hypothetical protein